MIERYLLAVLMTAFLIPQDPPPVPEEGVVVRDLGIGFHATCELPNLPLRLGEPRKPPYVGRTDTWMPFQITLENFGPAVEGTLILRDAFENGAPDLTFRKRVTLPARARKHVKFPVFHRGGQSPRLISFEDDRKGTILLDGARSLPVPPPHTTGAASTLVMIATESRGNFSHFLGRTQGATFVQNRYLLPVLPRELPSRAIEYHGVDTLVLDDIPVDALSGDQQEAIRQFVVRGGTLVVSVFRRADRIGQTPLAELLPGAQDGIQNVREVLALEAATGYRCPLDAPLAMVTFRAGPESRRWDDSMPVVAHRRFERGVVIACGFPFSASFLETWPGASRFLEILSESALADPVPLSGGIQTSTIRANIAKALKESMVRTLPPFRMVLGLMAGYAVVLALLPYAIFRRLNRLEWSWAGVLLFAAGGAGVVYGLGESYLRKDTAAYRVGLIEGGSQEGAHLRHNFWSLFTAKGDRLDLSFEEPSAVPYPLGRELKLRGTTAEEGMTISYDESRLADLRTYSQDSSLFETTDRVVLASRLLPMAREGPGGASVRLLTGGKFPIQRAWIVGSDDVSEVSDVPGEEVVVPVPNSTMAAVTGRLQASGDLLLDKVVRVLLPEAQTRSKMTGRRVVVYLYEGSPSLKNRTIRERSLDFGMVDVEGGEIAPAEEQWQFRRLTSGEQDGSYETAMYSPGGVVYSLVLKGLQDDCRARNIRLGEMPVFTLELFDHRTQTWKRVMGGATLDAEGLVHHSPLGCAYALLRTRMSPSSGHLNTYVLVSTSSNLHATSHIERKSP